MTADELAEITREIRTIGIVSPGLPVRAQSHDPDAERQVIAAAWEGCTVPSWLEAGHFYSRSHGQLLGFIATLRASGIDPTADRIVTMFDELGCRGSALRFAIEDIERTPLVPVDAPARRIVALYYRRAANDLIVRAEALTRLDVATDGDEMIELLRGAARNLKLMGRDPEEES